MASRRGARPASSLTRMRSAIVVMATYGGGGRCVAVKRAQRLICKPCQPRGRTPYYDGSWLRLRIETDGDAPARRRQRGPATIRAAPRRGEYRAPRSRAELRPFLLVLPRPCARLQRRLELLRRHERARDRARDPQRHGLAAPDLADGRAAPAWATRRASRDFGMFELDDEAAPSARTEQRRRPPSPQEQALAIFDLVPPLTCPASRRATRSW